MLNGQEIAISQTLILSNTILSAVSSKGYVRPAELIATAKKGKQMTEAIERLIDINVLKYNYKGHAIWHGKIQEQH